MCEDRRRSPGQWAPWIDDPDPPEEPLTPEQMVPRKPWTSAALYPIVYNAISTGGDHGDRAGADAGAARGRCR
jgi:hypothetical protein